MKTKFANNLIEVTLSRPETDATRKTLALVESLAKMQPVCPALSEAARKADEGLLEVLALVGAKSEE